MIAACVIAVLAGGLLVYYLVLRAQLRQRLEDFDARMQSHVDRATAVRPATLADLERLRIPVTRVPRHAGGSFASGGIVGPAPDGAAPGSPVVVSSSHVWVSPAAAAALLEREGVWDFRQGPRPPTIPRDERS